MTTSVRAGAWDPDAWSGIVISDAPGRGVGVRWAVERNGERADRGDLFFLVHDVGPNDPEGRYARVEFDTTLPFGKGNDTPIVPKAFRGAGFSLEWSRTDDGAVMRATAWFEGVLELRGYCPWDWKGAWSAGEDGLQWDGLDGPDGPEGWVTWDRVPDSISMEDGEAVARFAVVPGDVIRTQLLIVPTHVTTSRVDPARIDAVLSAGERAYAESRVGGEGTWRALPEAITNNVHWMVCLQPEAGRTYVPAGRRWIFPTPHGGRDHWTVFEWDGFFNALELGVESEALARDMLDAVLDTQFENGCLPNWRGRFWGTRDRSQPPIGSFCVLRHYLRFGDRALLERAFPVLDRWSDWWTAPVRGTPRRDGNANGLCEWGSDPDLVGDSPAPWERQASGWKRARWESGQDDLPNWDDAIWNEATGTLELDAVDLNGYLALDHECLARMADTLGHDERAAFHRERYAAIRDAMNALLWDDARGLYLDRHWDGRHSSRVAASNFLPLLAGIPSDEQAARMLATLEDPERFWGAYVVPSISRDDPAFADQQYWRGTIWPPTNYLLYHGLRRYARDAAASGLACASVALFLGTWHATRLCRENYDSRTGEGGGQRYQSWGPLFGLMGIEELLDVTPWDGLRLGTLHPPSHTTFRRLRACGYTWTVRVASDGLQVEASGDLRFETDAPIIARNVEIANGVLTANVTAERATTLRSATASTTIGAGTTAVTLRLV